LFTGSPTDALLEFFQKSKKNVINNNFRLIASVSSQPERGKAALHSRNRQFPLSFASSTQTGENLKARRRKREMRGKKKREVAIELFNQTLQASDSSKHDQSRKKNKNNQVFSPETETKKSC
jgi:hypothetical protein